MHTFRFIFSHFWRWKTLSPHFWTLAICCLLLLGQGAAWSACPPSVGTNSTRQLIIYFGLASDVTNASDPLGSLANSLLDQNFCNSLFNAINDCNYSSNVALDNFICAIVPTNSSTDHGTEKNYLDMYEIIEKPQTKN